MTTNPGTGRLADLRRTEEHDLAFTESKPFVSVVIPTYTSHETLREGAIPSVLAQSYENYDESAFDVPGLGKRAALGQSVCVLERPRT
jgi:hypothetical protein